MQNKKGVVHDGWDEYASKSIYHARGKKIGIGRSLGFGVFSMFSISMQGLVGAWLLFFYTTFCGLSAGQGATIFLIGRVADAIASLVMGNISDNIYKYKIGRCLAVATSSFWQLHHLSCLQSLYGLPG